MSLISAGSATAVAAILEAGASELQQRPSFHDSSSLQIIYRDLIGLAYRLKNTSQANWDERVVEFFFNDQDLALLRELAVPKGVYRRELELSSQRRHQLLRFSEALTSYLAESD